VDSEILVGALPEEVPYAIRNRKLSIVKPVLKKRN